MKIEKSKNKAEIKEAIKALLKKSFLMKAKDNNLELYLVTQDNLDIINEYLEVIDFEARINRDMEVISLNYIGNEGNLPPIYKMTMNEMKIFTCLLVIFTNKVQEDLISPDSVKANIKELKVELTNRDLRLIPNNKITTFQNALLILARYNLIEFIDKEMKDEYSEFRILPSIMFAKDDKRFLQMINKITDEDTGADNEIEMVIESEEEFLWEK
jgi:hypothetical protein